MAATPEIAAEIAAVTERRNRFETVDLLEPIVRGDALITAIKVRRPKAGELRGLALQDLLGTDMTAILKLIPRLTDPPITVDEVDDLDPEDVSEIGGVIRGFFMTRAERQAIEALFAEHRPKT